MDNMIKILTICLITASNLLILITILYFFLRDFFYDRLNKPNNLKRLRFSCKVQPILIILLIIFHSIRIYGFLIDAQPFKTYSIFSIIIFCIFLLICIMDYFKVCRYYLRNHDDNVILFRWYMEKYFKIKKKPKNHLQAYEYLLKASEYKSDSVFVWSMMALYNERSFDKPDLADQCLEKAQQILNTSENPSIKDKALFESVTGEILLDRDKIEEGLAHLKTASDIDPSDFNKKNYEEALKWAAENDESDNSSPVEPSPS